MATSNWQLAGSLRRERSSLRPLTPIRHFGRVRNRVIGSSVHRVIGRKPNAWMSQTSADSKQFSEQSMESNGHHQWQPLGYPQRALRDTKEVTRGYCAALSE